MNRHLIIGEKARRSFAFFCQEFWESADTSTPVWNWHMDYLCQVAQQYVSTLFNWQPKGNDLIINLPPGTSKSMIFSVLLPAWVLAKRPKTRIITASYSETIGLELAMKTRNLMQSDKWALCFPTIQLKADENSKGNYKTVQGGGRFVTSTGSNVIGLHGDLLIGDDLQNLDNVWSEKERDRVNRWTTGTLSTRKTDKERSLSIFIQQRLHPQDLTSHLLSLGTPFTLISLPASLDGAPIPSSLSASYINGMLDPVRLSSNVLQQYKLTLGTRNYNAQFLQRPDDESHSIIKRNWIKVISPEHFEALAQGKEFTYIMDTAYGGDKADFNVVLECVRIDGVLYISRVYRSLEEFPSFIRSINTFCTRGKRMLIEAKASGKSIIQQLRSSTSFNIQELVPKDSKLVRLAAVSPTVEGGRVVVVQGPWVDEFLDQVCTNNPPHDDMRDCFTYAVDDLIKGQSTGVYSWG